MTQPAILFLTLAAILFAGILYVKHRRAGRGPFPLRTVVFSLTLGAVLVGGLVLVFSRRAEVAAAPTPTDRPTPVRTEKARQGDLDDTRRFLGRVMPWQTAELSPQITSRLVQLDVREGERVRRGQILAILDADEIRNAMASASAQVAEIEARLEAQRASIASLEKSLDYWEQEMERDAALVDKGAVAQAAADATAEKFQEFEGRLEAESRTLDALERQAEAGRHRLEELRSRQEYTRIRSPFDGIVARREADPGDLAIPGKTLLIVDDLTRLRVAFDLPQDEAELIGQGTQIHLLDKDVQLQVDRLYPSLNPDRTRTVEAYASSSTGLLPGSFHSLEVVVRRFEDVTLVPESALVPMPQGGHAVFVVDSGMARSLPVRRLLIRNGVAALPGLPPGTPVVISTYLGWNRLSDEEAVEVIQ